MTKIVYAKDFSTLSRKAANIISAQVILYPTSVLGLATGASPLGVYRQLIEWYHKGDVDFSSVRAVNLDEYVGLEPQNPQSYKRFMYENFFRDINISAENCHIPDSLNPDVAAECARYNNVIRELGGIDLQLLGIGHNGHTGFNEPGEAFERETHCVTLSQRTVDANKRFFAGADQVPRKAYTMGIKNIMNARKILMIASGEEKAEILYRALLGKIEPSVPASILQLHNDVVVIADDGALSKIMAEAPGMVEKRYDYPSC